MMRKLINKMLFKLWPPYEYSFTSKDIIKKQQDYYNENNWNHLVKEFDKRIPKSLTDKEFIELESSSKDIFEAELKRKERVEGKAATFIASISFIISFVALIPNLISDTTKIPSPWIHFTIVCFLIAIIFLLVSAYYAVQVRKISAFVLPSVDGFLETLKEGRSPRERIKIHLANTKFNELGILLKTNYLCVVEKLFLRGISFVMAAVVIGIIGRFYGIQINNIWK